jgi:hypothetical protein
MRALYTKTFLYHSDFKDLMKNQHMIKKHCKSGQADTEFIIVFSVTLIVALMVIALNMFWPSYIYSIEKQKSEELFGSAMPFSIRQHGIISQRAILQITNNDASYLKILKLYVDAQKKPFLYHPLPFSLSNNQSVCSSSPPYNCNLEFYPGQTKMISFELSCPQQTYMKISISVEYSGSDNQAVNQSFAIPLIVDC